MSMVCESLHLPVLQPNVAQLLDKVQDENTNLQDLVQMIQLDAVLTTRVLKVANSGFYGMPRCVMDIGEAIQILGLGQVKGLVIAELVMKRFSQSPWNRLHLKTFWSDNLSIACLAQSMAPWWSLEPSQAWCAGLLHSLGQLVLAAQIGESYVDAMQTAPSSAQLNEFEQETLGLCHAEVGAELLSLWGLPESLCTAVGHQYESDVVGSLASVLFAAHVLQPALLFDETVPLNNSQHLKNVVLDSLNKTPKRFEQVLAHAKARYAVLLSVVQDE